MNCTECGKPHSKEQPLTVTGDTVMLCPDCLDIHKQASAAIDNGADPMVVLTRMYGVPFIDVSRPTTHYFEDAFNGEAVSKAMDDIAKKAIEAFRVTPQMIGEIDTNRPSK